jgi:hypothetical protein
MAVIDRVYLDTTVPSAYYDDRAPDRQRLTQEFWQGRCLEMEAVISTITLLEIRNTPNEDKRQKMEILVQSLTVLSFSAEADNLPKNTFDEVFSLKNTLRTPTMWPSPLFMELVTLLVGIFAI